MVLRTAESRSLLGVLDFSNAVCRTRGHFANMPGQRPEVLQPGGLRDDGLDSVERRLSDEAFIRHQTEGGAQVALQRRGAGQALCGFLADYSAGAGRFENGRRFNGKEFRDFRGMFQL